MSPPRPRPRAAPRRPRRGRALRGPLSRDCDHVAAPVAVPPDRPDRLADLEVRLGLDDAVGARARARGRRCGATRPVGSGPGSAVRNRIASGCEKRGRATLVGDGLAEGEPQRRPRRGRRRPRVARGRPSDRRGSAPRPRRRRTRPSVRGDQLRERDPVAEPERARRLARDRSACAELVVADATAGRRGSSRRRSRCRAAAAGRRA